MAMLSYSTIYNCIMEKYRDKSQFPYEVNNTIDDILFNLLHNIPDEVVKCKDCVKRDTDKCTMYYKCECGKEYISNSDDDFCSLAIKKVG